MSTREPIKPDNLFDATIYDAYFEKNDTELVLELADGRDVVISITRHPLEPYPYLSLEVTKPAHAQPRSPVHRSPLFRVSGMAVPGSPTRAWHVTFTREDVSYHTYMVSAKQALALRLRMLSLGWELGPLWDSAQAWTYLRTEPKEDSHG
jgi:hypothetical protein